MKLTVTHKQNVNHCLTNLYAYYETCGTPYDFMAFAQLKSILEYVFLNNIEVDFKTITHEIDKYEILPCNPMNLIDKDD